MVGIVAQFEMDIQQRKKAYAHAGSQPEDVNAGEDLVIGEVSESGFKIVPEHG
jgi:hypothetical protein